MPTYMRLALVLQNLIVEELTSDIYNTGTECAHLCYLDKTCVSYFYNADNKNCIPYTTMLSYGFDDLDTETAMGYRYFEWRKAGCDHGKEWRFDRTTGACFKIFLNSKVWGLSGQICDSYNSTLMSADTTDKLNLLSTISSSTESDVWVGGRRVNDTLLWISGQAVNPSSLGSGCDAYDRSCLALVSDEGLCTFICGVKKPFVCEKNEITVEC